MHALWRPTDNSEKSCDASLAFRGEGLPGSFLTSFMSSNSSCNCWYCSCQCSAASRDSTCSSSNVLFRNRKCSLSSQPSATRSMKCSCNSSPSTKVPNSSHCNNNMLFFTCAASKHSCAWASAASIFASCALTTLSTSSCGFSSLSNLGDRGATRDAMGVKKTGDASSAPELSSSALSGRNAWLGIQVGFNNFASSLMSTVPEPSVSRSSKRIPTSVSDNSSGEILSFTRNACKKSRFANGL
mmetsp:Transcript_2534/g.6341  ORF Transcript_2534/g.6341 Transcript_2534/m.6341 type:complete len:242 (+) Transcript_2534:463-1188(+)